MGKSGIQNLVQDISGKNARAVAALDSHFKLDIPSVLDFRFVGKTEEHVSHLAKEINSLGFTNASVSLGRREWLLSAETNTPIKTIIAPKFVERLASALGKHKCVLDRWQKRFIM